MMIDFDSMMLSAANSEADGFSIPPLPPTDRDADRQVYCFGSFSLLPKQRILFNAGKGLRIGGRALDILVCLVQRHGAIVTKAELIEFAWPNVFVDEHNLRVHIATLQKTLGRDPDGRRYIINVVGRGYAFVGRTRDLIDIATPHVAATPWAPPAPSNMNERG
jgi:DNA-binding winged helix-turn-helix (wHTH) protein